MTIGQASVVLAPWIDTVIASYLHRQPDGARYADRINQLPLGGVGHRAGHGVVAGNVGAAGARRSAAGSDSAQNRSAAMTLLLTLPFVFAFIAIPGVLMRAVFAHGAFDSEAAMLAAGAGGLRRFSLPWRDPYHRPTFYARHDTATPARATLIAMTCNIALKFSIRLGFGLGVAVRIGHAFGAWINVAVSDLIGKNRALPAIESSSCARFPPLLAAMACGAGPG